MAWRFSYNQAFSDTIPLAKKRNDDTKEEVVVLDIANLSPRPDTSWQAIIDGCQADTMSETKLVYLTRHGKSVHNTKSEQFGKAIYYEYFATDPKFIDPELEEEGIEQACRAGQIIRDSPLPKPKTFVSSPLRRALQTDIHLMKAMMGASSTVPRIHITDGCREWQGMGHNHSSDKRSKRAEITALVESMGAEPRFDPLFKEDDKEVLENETYADVRARLEKMLNENFDYDNNNVIHLCLHNRCFKCFLGVIGHTEEEEYNLDNCATVVYLVTRTKLNKEERLEKEKEHHRRSQLEEANLGC